MRSLPHDNPVALAILTAGPRSEQPRDPECSHEVSRDHIGWVVDTEINAREPDGGNQHQRCCPGGGARPNILSPCGKDPSEDTVEARRKKRVAAGETVAFGRRPEERFRAGTMKGIFKGVLQHDRAGHHHRQREGGSSASAGVEADERDAEECCDHRNRAEPGDRAREEREIGGGELMDARSNPLIETPDGPGAGSDRQPDEQAQASGGTGQQCPLARPSRIIMQPVAVRLACATSLRIPVRSDPSPKGRSRPVRRPISACRPRFPAARSG